MLLGGFLPLTLLDFPGRVACIAFSQGCNLRCGYCHNPQLIGLRAPAGATTSAESQVLGFLATRRGVLDGVVVSGGEPTIQPDLLPFLLRIKDLGFLVKLDTNGTNPPVLRDAHQRRLVDYVAMDVKHDPARYGEITGAPVDPDVLAASRDLLRSQGVAHEFRTTIVPRYHDEAAMERIARFCEGASRFVLQSLVPAHARKRAFRRYAPPTPGELQRLKRIAERFIGTVEVLDACRGGPIGAGSDWRPGTRG